MNTSDEGLAVLKHFEGCMLEAYPDPATGGDPWTIGYGDTGPDVVEGLTITQEEADDRLRARLAREFEPGVERVLTREPTQEFFDAAVCLSYNIGLGNFKGSSVVKRFNAGDDEGAAAAILMWDKAAGKSMHGLRRRRAAEQALASGAEADQAIAIGTAVA